MNNEQFQQILQRYQSGQASEPETAFVEAYYAAFDVRPDITEELSSDEQMKLEELLYADLFKEVSVVKEVHRVHFLKTAWFRYAAILLLIAGTAGFLYLSNQPQKDTAIRTKDARSTEIQPGGNKAILTLADGSTIVLDSAANGSLAQQGNISVIKLANGQLAYNPSSNLEGSPQGDPDKKQAGLGEPSRLTAASYNTISTPKGGQYQIVLPDGTRVWLNAASSIRFPTAFTKDRTVEITGESYLEVAADKSTPFFVKAGANTIQVLGTSFNVNAYTDENAVKTTLIEGSIKVLKQDGEINHADAGPNPRKASPRSGAEVILKPGQQASITTSQLTVQPVNTRNITAWKNGWFEFDNASIQTIMRELSRWYNIDVRYEGTITDRFNSNIQRNVPLSQIFKRLALTNKVHFTIHENTVTVTP